MRRYEVKMEEGEGDISCDTSFNAKKKIIQRELHYVDNRARDIVRYIWYSLKSEKSDVR